MRSLKNLSIVLTFVSILSIMSCNRREVRDMGLSFIPTPSIMVDSADALPSLNLSQSDNHDFMDREVDELHIIPLETTKECLIGSITDLYLIGDTLVVVDGQKAKQIFLFNLQGKLLNIIGRAGGGPEEYSSISHAYADNGGIDIYDMNTSRFIGYDYSGNMVRSTTFNETSPTIVLPLTDSTFIASYASYFEQFPFALQWLAGDSIVDTAFPYKINRRESAPLFFKLNENELGVHMPATDTIYSIKEGRITPKLTLGLISEEQSREYRRESSLMNIAEERDYLLYNKKAPACMVEVTPTQDYLIITHQKGIKSYISVVDRQTLQSRTYLTSCFKPASLYMPPYLKSSYGNTLVGFISDDYFTQLPKKSRQYIEKYFSEQDQQILKNYDYANSNPIIWTMELK